MNETKELIEIASYFCDSEYTEKENPALNYKRCRSAFTSFEEVLESMQDNDTLVLSYANICSEGKKHYLKAKIRHNVGEYKIIYDFEFIRYTGATDELKHYQAIGSSGSFKLTRKVLFFNYLKFKKLNGTIIDSDSNPDFPMALMHVDSRSKEDCYNKVLKEILFADIRSIRSLVKRVKFNTDYFRPIYDDLRLFLWTNCTELETTSKNTVVIIFHLSKNRRVILDIQERCIYFTGVNGDLIKNHTIPIYTGPFNLFLRSTASVFEDLKQQIKLTKLI